MFPKKHNQKYIDLKCLLLIFYFLSVLNFVGWKELLRIFVPFRSH